MRKRLKELAGQATENQLVTMIRESTNQTWLAGLGAFSKAQHEGAKMFEALVAEGEKVQERTKVAADERLAEVREKATGAWDKLEKVFEDRAARALHALNVPSHRDIDTLSKRVHVITKQLSEEEETRGHGRAHRVRAE
jgi:poly(hydroxyalkanoate) granule-associated protein